MWLIATDCKWQLNDRCSPTRSGLQKERLIDNHLVLTALGADRPGIINQLSSTVFDCDCSIADSRMTVLGGEFALILMVSGNWDAVAKLEAMVPTLEAQLDLTIVSKRTDPRDNNQDKIPYEVEVVALDHPGIVNDIAKFFSEQGLNIENMETECYAAAHTGTPMFSITMVVSLPADISIAQLRDDFTGFCDDLNLDGSMEPAAR